MSVFEEWNQRESLSNPPKAAGSRSSHVASQPSAAPANNPFARGGAGGASPPRASISGGSASGANPFTRGGSNPNQGASSALATAQTSDTKVLATASDAADRDSIFSLEPIPWQDTVGGSGVSSVAVGNSLMCLALPGCRILRWRATRDAKPEEVEIVARPAKGETIHKVFVDPHGFHCFVALTSGRVYYLHARAKVAKKLGGWRTTLNGQMVESMAFDAPHVSETTTRALLLGTSGGKLYETVVDSTGKAAPPVLVHTLDIVDEKQQQHQQGSGGSSSSSSSGGGGSAVSGARVGALHVVSVGLRNGAGSSGVGVDVVGGATEKASSSLGLVTGSLNPSSSSSSARDSFIGRGSELDAQNNGSDSSKDDGRLLVLCATDAPTRLYSFLGGPTFADLFGAAEQQGYAAGAASTWTFTELGALSGSQRVELLRYERLDQHRSKAMGRLGVSVVSGGMGGSSASLTDQASLFALLTEHGIYHGGLQVKSGGSGASVQAPSEAVVEPGLLPYPPPRGTPIAIDMTAYHFLALYPDRILCLSRLSGELVQELMLPVPLAPSSRDSTSDASSPSASVKYSGGFVRDAATNAVFVWSSNGGVWQVQVAHEARDVWSLYLDRALASSGPSSSARFDDALRLADGPQQRQIVLAKQANWYFDRKEYAKAARTFAKVQAEPWPLSGLLTFEAVTLKLMEADAEAALVALASSSTSSSNRKAYHQDASDDGAALEVFLEEKLRVSEVGGKVQATMLTTWLLECYLKRLIYLPDPKDSREEAKGDPADMQALLQKREDLELKLLDFLEEHQGSLDHDTTFQLLDGHGHAEAALKFAMVVEDSVAKFERICAHYASRQQWLDVLHVLDEASFNKVHGLFYRFSSALMDAVPGPTVVVWKRKPQLNPTKLIPALVAYAQKRDAKIALEKSSSVPSSTPPAAPQRRGSALLLQQNNNSGAASAASSNNERNYAVEFLEHCIGRNTGNAQPGSADKAIYNYLLLLHAQSHDHGAALLRFLDAHLPSSSSAHNSSTRFDLEYALRVCTSTNQIAAAVRVYAALGLHEDAVRLALKVDVPMAKRLASSSLHDYELTRRLWLLVAQHTVATVTDPKLALGILDECPSVTTNTPAGASSSGADSKRSASAAAAGGAAATSSSNAAATATAKVLTIEDVLPFFGEMATIDDFKAKVVEALETYDAHIDGLKREMDGFAESAREVHRAIDALGERQLTVDPQALCPLSGKRVFDGPFYVFPSGYACAQQPLIAHVTPHLPTHKQRRVRDLCARLGYAPPPRSMRPNGLNLNMNSSSSSSSAKQQQAALLEKEAREEAKEQERLEALRAGPGASLSASERDAFQTQLDDLVAGECPLTGTLAIEMVDAPLLSAYEAAMERSSWAI